MQTNSYFRGNVKQKFEKFFDKSLLNRLAKSNGFVQRASKKVSGYAFVAAFIDCYTSGCHTFSAWAAAISCLTRQTLTKQGLHERMNPQAVAFCKAAFQQAMSSRLKAVRQGRLFSTFNRVLLQDSTTLSLPQCLSKPFPGNYSRGSQKAVARLQCLLNVRTMQWLHIDLKAFTDNDQSASGEVLPLLKQGDLLIRDLGYFVLRVFSEIVRQKAFFISRLRYGIALYDENGKVITWKKLARNKGMVDCQVWAGKKEKVPVRLILIPLPAPVAAERVRKAKADRDRRLNHSADYYRWLGYSVFISNVEAETLTATQVAEVYKVRWQIETVFKSWKSGYGLQELVRYGYTNEYRAKACIYLLLMVICLVAQHVYVGYYKCIEKAYGKRLSLLKVARFALANLQFIICGSRTEIKKQLALQCCYDKRKDRQNMDEFIYNLCPLP